jgi:hypothetical protein
MVIMEKMVLFMKKIFNIVIMEKMVLFMKKILI